MSVGNNIKMVNMARQKAVSKSLTQLLDNMVCGGRGGNGAYAY